MSASTVLLDQMLGVEKRVKQNANKDLGAIQKELGRTPQMNGITRTYRPLKEDDPERLPGEQTRVQVKVVDLLVRVSDIMTQMFDVVLTREAGNGVATADLVVNSDTGEPVTIAEQVPVTYLLFLDKQMDDLISIIRSVPVHDPAEEWIAASEPGIWQTPTRETHRAKKVPFPFIKAPATDKHPAQVETQFEDRVVGFWDKIVTTGTLPAGRVHSLLARAEKLQLGIKAARAKANATEVEQRKIGANIFGFLFA